MEVGLNKTEFYKINDKHYKSFNRHITNGVTGYISFALDKESIEYERVVFSILDMFGFLGGLYDFIYYFGYFLIMIFQIQVLSNYQILSKLYHVEVDNSREEEEKSKLDRQLSPFRLFYSARKNKKKFRDEDNYDSIENAKEQNNSLKESKFPTINKFVKHENKANHEETNQK